MANINDSIRYVSELFSAFFVADMNRRRAECFVHADPANPDDAPFYDEAVNEASFYAEHDAERIAGIITSIAYKRGGVFALTTLAEHVANLNGSDATVIVEDLKTPASNAIGHLLAVYDIDTDTWQVLKNAAEAFSRHVEGLGDAAAKYTNHISDLVDAEGGSVSDTMEREPFTEWLKSNTL